MDEPTSKAAVEPDSAELLMPLRSALVRSVGTGMVFVGGLFFLFYLLIGHPHLSHEPLTSDELFNLLKLAFAVVAGIGGTVALVMNYRKQRLAEIKAEQETGAEARAGRVELREQDKLFTERFTQAAQQLGSERAAVRLAGAYALARIADDSARDRPTCLKVLCAYLRMPYQAEAGGDEGERQVRVTAQTQVAERLRPSHLGYWHDAQVDLRGAHLIDADFDGCVIGHALFNEARFVGEASFGSAVVNGTASFEKAIFESGAAFSGSTFASAGIFDGAAFGDHGLFDGVAFAGPASFDGATFSGVAHFHRTGFGDTARFADATFVQDAEFDTARFDEASFAATTFKGIAHFREATFAKAAQFSKAVFRLEAQFDATDFRADTWFDGATFGEAARFGRARFAQDAKFRKATFTEAARFDTTQFGRGTWFDSAVFHGSTRFDSAVFTGGARFNTTVFSGPAWFDTATFNSEARFDLAQFERQVRFDQASFAEDSPPVWPSGFTPSNAREPSGTLDRDR